MDMNSYLVEWLAKERLGELRAALARQQLAASVRQSSPLRVRLGLALIAFGRRLQGSHGALASRASGAPAAS
jgi:hypothetical protein